jgi:hypothetical protein
VEKCYSAGLAIDDSMTHAHCMLDTWIRICNTYSFSTASKIARTRLSIGLCLVVIHNFSLGIDFTFIVRFCRCFLVSCSCVLTLNTIGKTFIFHYRNREWPSWLNVGKPQPVEQYLLKAFPFGPITCHCGSQITRFSLAVPNLLFGSLRQAHTSTV